MVGLPGAWRKAAPALSEGAACSERVPAVKIQETGVHDKTFRTWWEQGAESRGRMKEQTK